MTRVALGTCASFSPPKPAAESIGKKFEYYMEFQLEGSDVVRTPHYEPPVVKKSKDCPAER